MHAAGFRVNDRFVWCILLAPCFYCGSHSRKSYSPRLALLSGPVQLRSSHQAELRSVKHEHAEALRLFDDKLRREVQVCALVALPCTCGLR